jgi:hypothetical protein
LSHIEQCAAIAEIEAEIQSGETAEDSLFAVPEGMSHVQSAMMFFNKDVCPADTVTEGRGGGRDKERKGTKEEQKKDRRRKDQEAVSAALLSLNPRKCGKVDSEVL